MKGDFKKRAIFTSTGELESVDEFVFSDSPEMIFLAPPTEAKEENKRLVEKTWDKIMALEGLNVCGRISLTCTKREDGALDLRVDITDRTGQMYGGIITITPEMKADGYPEDYKINQLVACTENTLPKLPKSGDWLSMKELERAGLVFVLSGFGK